MSDMNSFSFYEPALTKHSKRKGVKKRVEGEKHMENNRRYYTVEY